MDTNILLENGTNELEVLEFKLGDRFYGINVAKVREIIHYQDVTPVPNGHPGIEGIFMPREDIITAIDLKNCLQMGESVPGGLFIITNFNSLNLAFHVDSVVGIHRISWADIMKPSSTAAGNEDGVSTGIIKIDGKLIIILDFEKIVSDINPEISLKMTDMEGVGTKVERGDIPILIAEDSVLLNRLIVKSLATAGYTRLTHTENGQQAWDLLCQWKAEGTLDKNVRCLITDIEMPQMDGHRLTKLVKEDRELQGLKVIIFSSMINDDLRRKGEQLGADMQLTKPEIGRLIRAVDSLMGIEGED